MYETGRGFVLHYRCSHQLASPSTPFPMFTAALLRGCASVSEAVKTNDHVLQTPHPLVQLPRRILTSLFPTPSCQHAAVFGKQVNKQLRDRSQSFSFELLNNQFYEMMHHECMKTGQDTLNKCGNILVFDKNHFRVNQQWAGLKTNDMTS